MCVRAKANDLAHVRKERKAGIIQLIQMDYGTAGEADVDMNFEFVVATDMSTGSIWSSHIIKKGRDDLYAIASAVSWLVELGHSKVELQAGGPSEIVFMHAVRTKALKEGVCETILTRVAEPYNSQANGGAERTVQTVRKQMRALKLSIESRLQGPMPVECEMLT